MSSWKNTMPDSERYTYDYFFLDYVCRICWCADGVVELTSYSSKLDEKSTVAEKILECVGIDVSITTHPKSVCSKCLNEIELFTEFKRFCQETDKKLLNIIQNGNKSKTPVNENLKTNAKPDSDAEFSTMELDDSIDDILVDLPLSSDDSDQRQTNTKKQKKRAPTYCNFCHLNLESVENFVQHNIKCHGIQENGLYHCFGCEKTFKHAKKRLRHEIDSCKELRFGYKCSICNRYLAKRRLFELHMKNHRDNKVVELPDEGFKCKSCLRSFDSTDLLKNHILIHHQKETKNWVCDTCGRVFTRPDYLRKHKLMHEGNKQHKCPHCEFSTVQRSSLTVHIRKHTGERPYVCDLCPRRCVTSSNLRAHRKRHFGVKSFACQLCDKKFGYKISLQEHISSTHEQSEFHTCQQCGANYSRFRGLRRHLLSKHGKKVKKVKNSTIEIDCEVETELRENEGRSL